MKFKEFKDWCNHRASDGCWGMRTFMFCADVVEQVNDQPFWKRERKWQELNEEYGIENNIITPINNKIAELENSIREDLVCQ